VTVALDVAIVAPCAIVAGMLILRRNATEYRMAFPLFGVIVFLMPVIALATWPRAREGVVFTTGKIVGTMVSFALRGRAVGVGGRRGAPDAASVPCRVVRTTDSLVVAPFRAGRSQDASVNSAK
jgi:hypothetical protein